MSDRDPVVYVWTVRTADDRTLPSIGTLAEYARAREMAELSGDHLVSSTVWIGNEEGLLVGLPVKIQRDPATENGSIPYSYSVNGETVIHFEVA